MVVLNIGTETEKKYLYMDNQLHKRIEAVIRPKISKKDHDWVWIVDGAEGSGKSVFAMQLAKVVDPSFCLEREAMTPNEFTKAIIKAGHGNAVVFDEGFTGLSSRASLSEVNRLIVSLMMEMRQKNLFVVIVMPTIFLLDRYVALFRAKGLFHIYTRQGNRGRWVYFNNKNKKLLYILGKKLYSYSKPRSRFRGRFRNQYVVDEQEYRNKKVEALTNKSRNTRSETYKYQRDLLFFLINKKYNVPLIQMSTDCKKIGFQINKSVMAEVITEKNIQITAKEESET